MTAGRDVVPVEALVPPMLRSELEHYEWLIDGLLQGVQRASREQRTVEVLAYARDLFAELVARVVPVPDEAPPGPVSRAAPPTV